MTYKPSHFQIFSPSAAGFVSQCLFTLALRVPGGWIYRSYDKGSNILSAVFVRFDNEFQPFPTQASETEE